MHSEVIIVDENDIEIGTMEKMEAHRKGLLHRAFSVLIFNSKGELLLQQRALHKYHSPGLWANTCCSHPRKGEDLIAAAKRRLNEEMGFVCDLTVAGHFIYRCDFDNGLTEHEFDYVLKGIYDNDPVINPDEVMNYKWSNIDLLKKEFELNPSLFTFWFKELLQRNFI